VPDNKEGMEEHDLPRVRDKEGKRSGDLGDVGVLGYEGLMGRKGISRRETPKGRS